MEQNECECPCECPLEVNECTGNLSNAENSDGKTHLDKPYCALQKECFGGIVGAKSPYADGLGLLDEEVASLNMIKSAPVGPVAGGIMGCIMVLVLAVYAYRHQIHRRSHQHMSPLAAQ
ncbi:VWFA and cache domain-containing protein 1, partial [Goodea atripinnis]